MIRCFYHKAETVSFLAVHTAPEAHPAPCTICTWSFLVEKRPESRADQPPPLVGLSVWEWDGVIPPPPLCACIGLSWGDLLYIVLGPEFIRPTSLVTSCRLSKHMELGWFSEARTPGSASETVVFEVMESESSVAMGMPSNNASFYVCWYIRITQEMSSESQTKIFLRASCKHERDFWIRENSRINRFNSREEENTRNTWWLRKARWNWR
jgi:hypothetical protein